MSDLIAIVFFFKQKTAYEMRISDWSSDVCSSDLRDGVQRVEPEIEADRRVAGVLGLIFERQHQGGGWIGGGLAHAPKNFRPNTDDHSTAANSSQLSCS